MIQAGWNPETLKQLLDQRFDALEETITRRFATIEREMNERFESQDRATKAALLSASNAVDKAEHLADLRASAQNEWRGTVSDVLARNSGMQKGSSETWAKIAVAIVSVGTFTTVVVGVLSLIWGH